MIFNDDGWRYVEKDGKKFVDFDMGNRVGEQVIRFNFGDVEKEEE